VLHVVLAESNAQQACTCTATSAMQGQWKRVTIHTNNVRCQDQAQVTKVGAVKC